MAETADKTLKPSTSAQHVARKSSFFGKDGGDASFFSAGKGFFGSHSIQAKLNVSKPDDPQEKEADHVAEKVMTMPEPAAATEKKEEEPKVQKKEEEKKEEKVQAKEIEKEEKVQKKEEDKKEEVVQKKCAECEAEEQEEAEIQTKKLSTYTIQRSGRDPPRSSIPFEQSLSSSKGGGTPLPNDTRTFMESRFGADFSGVRIHTGASAERMNSQVHAQAFTHGNDIYFNSGKYSPGTTSGSTLLAHELTHTIQQGASRHVSSPSSSSINTKVSTKPELARKTTIQRVGEGAAVPQLAAAVEQAKTKEGKINANTEGPDGFRTGWQDLVEIFKTTFGEDQIVSGSGSGQKGSVAEQDIKKKRTVDNMLIVDPSNVSNTIYGPRDAMPSWCGIFVIWALNKGGVPMPKWKLGENMFKPEGAHPGGYTPKPGDIAYRNAFSHYAIVEKVTGATVTTVNGNTAGEDNLGGQVQSRDHPISDWTGFFDPLKFKNGDLGTGEKGEEKTRSLDELRQKLFGVSRKSEHESAPAEIKEDEQKENEQVDKKEIQTKREFSNWSVNRKGELQTASVESKAEEKELQKKEEQEKEEESPPKTVQKQIQRRENDATRARPPPVSIQPQTIQRSWLGDAWNAVSNVVSEAAAFIERGLDAAKEWLLGKVRDFVSVIPGYSLVSVILGRDPITRVRVERNGTNLLNAGLDILPVGHMFRALMNRLGIFNDVALWLDGRINDVVTVASGIADSFSRFWEGITLESAGDPEKVMNDVAGLLRDAITQVVGFIERSASEFLEMVKRVIIREVAAFIRTRIPRLYPLLTVALGFDPETFQPVARNGMNILNALLEVSEEGREQRKQMTETGTLQRIAGWIDRGIAVFSTAYQLLMQAFHNIWNYVTIENLFSPVQTFTRIYDEFARPVGMVTQFLIDAAIEILKVIKDALLRRLKAFALTMRGYHLITVIIGRDVFTGETVPRTVHNLVRGFMSLMEGGEEQYQQLVQSGAIDRTVARVMAAVARLNMTPAAILDMFRRIWEGFSLRDLIDPIGAFRRVMNEFGAPIRRLFAFIIEIVKIVVEVILRIMNFPIDLVNNIIAKAMLAFDLIKADPVGFLKNLLKAIKQGFIQFFDNIGTHLLNGLTGWLLNELRDANVPAPTDFSLRGIISWILAVLGLSMESIWQKLAAHPRIGPQRVARIRSMINTLEGIWTFIKDVQERGIAAIWDKIQEQLTTLWDTVLDAIKNWIMEKIVGAVVTKLLSMLDPTGIMAVINSAIAIYRAVQSFIQYLRQMLEVINSFVEGTVEIAQGNTKRAADFLERTMDRAMPIVIGFLANQVGLGGVGRRVGEMIGRARELVDQALTWLVNKAVDTGFALIDRAMAFGRSVAEGPDNRTPQEKQAAVTAAKNDSQVLLDNPDATLDSIRAGVDPIKRRHRLARIEVENTAPNEYDIYVALTEDKTTKKKLLSDDDMLNLAKADAKFNGKTFKVWELNDFMKANGWSQTTCERRVRIWKQDPKKLWVSESAGGATDWNKDAAFDPALIVTAVRRVLHDNRAFYGYGNFAQDSDKGIQVIRKGLIIEQDPASPTGYKHGYEPRFEFDKNYYRTQARFRCKRTGMEIQWGNIHMGHHPVGASQHWNNGGGAGQHTNPGHTQTRDQNSIWNNNTDNYWGPEDERTSQGTGGGTEGYRIPEPPDSHEMWWNPSHPNFRER